MASSSSSRRGSIASALASSSRLRPAMGRLSAGSSRRSAQVDEVEHLVGLLHRLARPSGCAPPAPYIAPTATFSSTRQVGERPHDLKRARDAHAGRSGAAAARPAAGPRRRSCPRVGGATPVIRLTSVVLPAPFGPIRPRISPGVHVEADVLDGHDAAEALGGVAHLAGSARSYAVGGQVARRRRARSGGVRVRDEQHHPARQEQHDQRRPAARRSRPARPETRRCWTTSAAPPECRTG